MLRKKRDGRRALVVPATIAAVIAVVALVFSAGLVGMAGSPETATRDEPEPVRQDERAQARSELTGEVAQPDPLRLDRSAPRKLVMPAIGVESRLLRLGLDEADNTVQQPRDPRRAGWFTRSVTPGQVGVSIIIGYIRTPENEPGVFARLRRLDTGHKITVRREDGTVAVFRVNDISSYPKGEFPAAKVYAQTDEPELRLISSGGTLKPKDPPGNVVISASLVDAR